MMRRRVCLILLLVAAAADAQRKPQPKPAEIELSDVIVRREGKHVNIDGRLKNAGERAAKKLAIFIDFLSPDNQVLTTRRAGIEEEELEPGGEAELHARVPDPVRAVSIRFNFEDGSGRYLKGINAGPFAIE
jgi:hypothetical protein